MIVVDIYVTFMKCMHAFGVMLPPASGCQYKIVRITIQMRPEEKIIPISFFSVFKYLLFFSHFYATAVLLISYKKRGTKKSSTRFILRVT